MKNSVNVITNINKARNEFTAKEIIKTYRVVNIISIILSIISITGVVCIIGFVDNLSIPGILFGFLAAFLPLTWLSWLDKVGWNNPETRTIINNAKYYLKYIKNN